MRVFIVLKTDCAGTKVCKVFICEASAVKQCKIYRAECNYPAEFSYVGRDVSKQAC